MLENVNLWLTIISTALGIIITVLGFSIRLIKNEKARKIAEKAKKIADDALKMTNFLKNGIVEAEKFTHYTGEEKKNYVLTITNQFAIQNNIDFDKEEVGKQIDELVALTRQVNQREKDKKAQ